MPCKAEPMLRDSPATRSLRMDHLLLSPALKPRLKAADVDRQVREWEKSSDHAPVWIELSGVKAKRAVKTLRR